MCFLCDKQDHGHVLDESTKEIIKKIQLLLLSYFFSFAQL